MSARTGTAELPLHGGKIPEWLATRMASLARVLVEILVREYGASEVLRRLSHPFWFQALGAVMGMDWHSSGVTTAVVGALTRGLAPVSDELGLWCVGGRGRVATTTPEQLRALADRRSLDGDGLIRASRLTARVDALAVQDGYSLYLHAMLVDASGGWAVVQQGMNGEAGWARRYHWLSDTVGSFLEAPHEAIEGRPGGPIRNLTDPRAGASRAAQVALLQPGELARALPALHLPARHEVVASDIELRRLHATLRAAADAGPRDFAELLMLPSVGARTVEALAHLAEVLHGAPSRFEDPARFSLALGGKDGHPFPVPLRVYDETLRVLRDGVAQARLGRSERLEALARLDARARALEQAELGGPPFDELVRRERRASPGWGGRTAAGPVGASAGAVRVRRRDEEPGARRPQRPAR